MRGKTNFLKLSILLLGVFLVFASSCIKDDDDNAGKIKGTFTDSRDGKVYQTVTIGSQVWMAENLAYLPSVVEPGTLSYTTPYYYVYEYNGTDVADAKAISNFRIYGVLYNWEAAKLACPTGWHLPSDAEWKQLMDYLGGEGLAGGKLKGTKHWISPNTGANNQTGFTALPGGLLNFGGLFGNVGYAGYWWCATRINTDEAISWMLSHCCSGIASTPFTKDLGFSVRCLRD
jgi:uncharacterized protein (TIGR02145 family)